jgi:predicted transcriptional regulator
MKQLEIDFSKPYPETPGWKEPTTSRDAAIAMAPKVSDLHRQVLGLLAGRDMTPDEIAGYLRRSVLAVRPRLTELAHMGLIERTGERRLNQSGLQAHVYRLTHA